MRMGLTLTLTGVRLVGSTFMVWGLPLSWGGSNRDTLAVAWGHPRHVRGPL